MDFAAVTTAVTNQLTTNAPVITAVMGLVAGIGLVFRLIRRSAKG